MSEPWFPDANAFGMWYGVLAGGVGGSLAGLLGAAAGILIQRGRGRAWILGFMRAFMIAGGLQLAFGLAALVARQPFAIWYPPSLCGLIYLGVNGANYRMVRRGYDSAEERRVQAQAIRNS